MMSMRKQRKIVVLGFSMVGKTAICVRFCEGKFSDWYEPTYETSFRKQVRHQFDDIDLVVLDTQGQDDQDVFRAEYCLGAHGYLLVYSVSSQRSLDACIALNDKLLSLMGTQNVPRVLVGNKTDMYSERAVSYEQGAQTANRLGCRFVECSAKQNTNIEKLFRVLLKEVDSSTRGDDDYSDISCSGLLRVCTGLASDSKLLVFASVCIMLTLFLGVACVCTGLAVGISARNPHPQQDDLLAYTLFGFGLFTALVSALGCAGIFKMRREYISAYAWTLSIIMVVQVIFWAFLLRSIQWSKDHPSGSIMLMTFVLLLQFISVVASCCALPNLEVSQPEYEPLASPPLPMMQPSLI